MKYMMFIKHAESYRSQPIPPELLKAMGEFVNAGLQKGWLKETSGLKASSEGRRMRLSGGKLTVTDGPFSESKEVVGGFAIVEVDSKAEALEIGRQFMELHRVHWPQFECESEIRPFEDR